eukprot:5469-Alexandrium_andersonii.AAC.1
MRCDRTGSAGRCGRLAQRSSQRCWMGNRGRLHRRSQRPWGTPAFLPVGGRPVRWELTRRVRSRSERRGP